MPRLTAPVRAALLLALVTALPACLERKQTGQLNPDGSGKIVLETFVPVPPAIPEPNQIPPDALSIAKSVATHMVQDSRGVDAWKDLTIEKAVDGRAHVVGTCYFSDINKLQLDNPVPISWSRDAKGNYVLSLKTFSGDAGAPQQPLTDAQVSSIVSEGKADYKRSKPELEQTFAGLKINASLTLPGKITAANIFQRLTDNTVGLSIEGPQVLSAMDSIMADDKGLTDAIRKGRQPDADQGLLLEKMFNQKGPVSATVSGPVANLFDYPAEVAAAKAAQAAMYQRLGINPTAPVPQKPMFSPAPAAPAGR